MTLAITLSYPNSRLSANRKCNFGHLAQLRREQKQEAFVMAKNAGWHGARADKGLVITFCVPDRRKRDVDNLLSMFKGGIDGISQAMGQDDSIFDDIRIKKRFDGKGTQRVIVEIVQ